MWGAECKLGTTGRLRNTIRPKWRESFTFKLCHGVREENERAINIEVKDKNVTGAMLIGFCKIELDELLSAKGQTLEPEKGFQLHHPSKGPHGRLFAKFRFVPHDPTSADALGHEVRRRRCSSAHLSARARRVRLLL